MRVHVRKHSKIKLLRCQDVFVVHALIMHTILKKCCYKFDDKIHW